MNTMNTRLCNSWSSSELAEFSVIASSCSLLQIEHYERNVAE